MEKRVKKLKLLLLFSRLSSRAILVWGKGFGGSHHTDPHSCQGRVEIHFQGQWGTVCDDDWDLNDASVVCLQTGCGNAIAAHTNSFFGHGTGPIFLDNVNCTSTEFNLASCKSLGWGKHNCGHHEDDAGVTCSLS
uniref:SRCR domain-containing protein n=1 Tax=Nothobranchius furzeri TaxID=105023 RepID=A0A8C6LUY5_NOTFU